MKTNPTGYNLFSKRHIGPSESETAEMLEALDLSSLEDLMDQTVPGSIRLEEDLNLPSPLSEYKFLEELQKTAKKNMVYKSYIGLGYYDCLTPGVIERNIFENPGWYTQYTPYQAEISQGRLEALLNFQTLVIDLTKMEIANASLLDEATAAAEAMTMLHRVHGSDRKSPDAHKFFISERCFPQTIDVLKTRAEPLGIELTIGNHEEFSFGEGYFGALLQYPDSDGDIYDYSGFIEKAHENNILVAVSADLLSLVLLTPPGEFGADVVVGSAQRFGVPMGYGGPHAAFFATHKRFIRQVPGRIIGVSIDSNGDPAYRMALQTREQHIRREKATSNICTAQALLAIMAGMYAVYHGHEGLTSIACRIHATARFVQRELGTMGYKQVNGAFFDTLKVQMGKEAAKAIEKIRLLSESEGINFRYIDCEHIGISFDETTESDDVEKILRIFSALDNSEYDFSFFNKKFSEFEAEFPKDFCRVSDFLTHPVFQKYRSETKMLRYIKKLESRDLSLTTSMIPLGSCTMKLNATTEMLPVTWPEFSRLHPFAPKKQTLGYQLIFNELEGFLSEITGFHSVSLQPNSGAQGEYSGLLVIRDYYKNRGQSGRNVTLIPSSAHGTNPASAAMAGMRVVVVGCDDNGNIDIEDLKEKAEKHKDSLAALMITYPSTHGVFEEGVREMCQIVHDNGGQVYLDGANMNAQVGITSPARIGADVCHINLHKTFSIPHGGGGPGMGPICVAEHLSPYLPGHPVIDPGNGKNTSSVSASPWGSASILLVSYAYIKLLGSSGVKEATEYAILNANYIKSRLEKYYEVLYSGSNGRVAHEFILDLRRFKRDSGVDVEDIAKRLMDYGFHAPTISWPVAGTMMIEPTESEAKDELDRFCDAMISIYKEIEDIAEGKSDPKDNLLKGAPHTARAALIDEWKHPYSRKDALYPLSYIEDYKYWPPVGRVNNPHGDRNLVCSCPPIELYVE